MNLENKTALPSAKFPHIDFLKGLAILMVTTVHSSQSIPGLSQLFRDASSYGQMGCQLFFLISGFTIALSWKTKKRSLGRFYKQRFISIAPPFYFMIFFYMLLNFLLTSILHVGIRFEQNTHPLAILLNLFFLNGLFNFGNNDVVPGGWYIGTTMLFYLLFPLIIKLYEKAKEKSQELIYFIPLFSYIICNFIMQLLQRYIPQPNIFLLNDRNLLIQLPCLLLGITLYYQFMEKDILAKPKVNNTTLLLLSAILFLASLYDYFIGGITNPVFTCGVFFYSLFLLTYQLWERISKSLIVKLLCKLGKISYSAYFIHILFAWYGISMIEVLLNHYSIYINPDLLFIVIFVIFLPLIYIFSLLFDHVTNQFKKRLLH